MFYDKITIWGVGIHIAQRNDKNGNLLKSGKLNGQFTKDVKMATLGRHFLWK